MAESRARAVRALIGCAVALLAMSNASAVTASPSPPANFRMAEGKQRLFVPNSFELQGTNGYSIVVLGIPARNGRAGAVAIFVSKERMGVRYTAPATVTETSIQADLGELGEIAVTFHPSGQPTTPHSQCEKPVSFDSGNFEGTIDFHGEQGYTEAVATSVPGNINFLLYEICNTFFSGGGSGPSSPGAELYVRNPRLGATFSVAKERPSAKARFEVGVSEYHDGISIQRLATLFMPPGSFGYDSRLQAATVRPPAPFSGMAHFNRHKKANRRWSGDLTIDLPGRTDVPLTGRELRAVLIPTHSLNR